MKGMMELDGEADSGRKIWKQIENINVQRVIEHN